MIIHLIRDLKTIRAAESRLTADLFNPQSEILETSCWIVSLENFRRWGQTTPREFFIPAVLSKLTEDFSYHGLDVTTIEASLAFIFDFEEKELNHKFVLPILSKFLLTRQAAPLINDLSSGQLNTELIDELSKVRERSRITSADVSDLVALGTDVFAAEARIIVGYPPVDVLLGGLRRGEVVGLLGPMKGGKTSLCQSLASDWTKQRELGRVTYVSYEEPTAKQWPKFLICAMNNHSRVELEGKSASELSDAIKHDLAVASAHLAPSLSLIDMSGAVKGQGSGGISELEVCIDKLADEGTLGNLVIVDHALPLVMNYMGSQGIDPSRQMRHQIQELCTRFVSIIARHNIVGILAHQMDAAGNKNPLRVPTHMDAAECKHFAQVLHEVICLGVKDVNNIAYLNLSATRSSAPRSIQVVIAGWKCRVEMVSGWKEDSSSNTFVRPVDLKSGKLACSEKTGQILKSGGLHVVSSSTPPGIPGSKVNEQAN